MILYTYPEKLLAGKQELAVGPGDMQREDGAMLLSETAVRVWALPGLRKFEAGIL